MTGDGNTPVNCGDVINSPYNENTPYFDPASGSILFSSLGHSGMGGYDIFRSVKRNGTWTLPIGLPYKFNTIEDNDFFVPGIKDQGYLTSLFDKEKGSRNIYSLNADDAADKTISAEGEVSLQDGMAVDPVQTSIQLFDQKSGSLLKNISVSNLVPFEVLMKPGKFKVLISRVGDKTDTINLNVIKEEIAENKLLTDTASFRFEIKPGDYQLYINHVGYKTDTINLNIPSRYSSNYIAINSSLVPEKVFKGEFLTIKNLSV